MASEFLQKQRGEFSSFYLKLLAWKDQAIGYLGLGKDKPMAVQRIESPDPRMTPQQYADQRALIQAGIARGRRNIRIELAFATLFLTGVFAVGAYNWLTEQLGVSANINSQDNTQPSVTAPAPAEIVNTLAPTETQIPSTMTSLPPSATFAPTETAAEATERALPGELFELECPNLDTCQSQLIELLSPLVNTDWGRVKTVIWKNEVNFRDGDTLLTANRESVFSPESLGSFRMKWTAPSGEKRNDVGVIFGIQVGANRELWPVLPVQWHGKGNSIMIGMWNVGEVGPSGVAMSLNLTSSRDVTTLLFEKGKSVHMVEGILGPTNFEWNDETANFIASRQQGSAINGVKPLGLVGGISLEP